MKAAAVSAVQYGSRLKTYLCGLEDGPHELAVQQDLTWQIIFVAQDSNLGGCCGTDHRHVASIGHACKLAA
jgi:S-methylmethionine-dependent homocysteine/selenocysteine methylase